MEPEIQWLASLRAGTGGERAAILGAMTTPQLTDSDRQKLDVQVVYPWEDVSVPTSAKTFLTRGEGIYVHDSSGNRLIDGPGGMWCVNVGHGRTEIAEAIAQQALTLGYVSPWSFGMDHTLRLTQRLAAYAPGDLNHIFYTTCGSTAVDSALRFMFFYNNCRGLPAKKQIIARSGAYHGSTFLGATASGKTSDKLNMDMAEGLVHHVSNPKPLDRPDGVSVEQFCDDLVAELEEKILELGPETVGAFIAEPVLGSGGVVVPPPGYHKRTLEICHKYDLLYISDEVVTAFGRLGSMFASEDVYGIVPDMITTAKGLTSGYIPMGALFISDRLFDELRNLSVDHTYFTNGFTYSGHPVAVAAAEKNLDIFEGENILAHVQDVGPYFQERLAGLADLDVVWEVRGEGLMAAVELTLDAANPDEERDSEFAQIVDKISQENGLIVRPVYNSCVMSPPLIITREQIDQLVGILRSAIVQAAAEVHIS